MLQEIRNSSSDMHQRGKHTQKPWLLWLIVLALHATLLAGMDTALTVGRLAVLESRTLEVAIISERDSSAKVPTVKRPTKSQLNQAGLPPIAHRVQDAALPEPTLDPAPTPAPTIDVLPSPMPTVRLPPVALPPSAVLRYQLTQGGDSAKVSLIWQALQNSTYELTIEATYLGFSAFKQTSTGRIEVVGLVPVRHSDKRRGKSEQAAHFEHDNQRIVFSNNRPEASLSMGVQDRASMLIQLSGLLAADPAQDSTGRVLHLPVATTNELDTWAFDVHGRETVDLPMGSREAIKLSRRPRRAYDQLVELWFAPSEHYLPVRIRLTDSSGVTEQVLVGYETLR